MAECCKTCRFWRDEHDEWAGKGTCRRYPPTLGRDGDHSDLKFPRTVRSNWCGEYKYDLRLDYPGTATAIGEASTAADDAAPSVADLGDGE